MMPAMGSHLFYSIIQNDPDESAKLVYSLCEKNPDEIAHFLWTLSALIRGYVNLFEKINPVQKNQNQIFCKMLKDFPIEKHLSGHVSYTR